MSDNSFHERIPLRKQFSILRIFDAASAAVSPASIFLATIAAVILNLAVWLCDRALDVENASKLRGQTVVVVVRGIEPLDLGDSLGSSLGKPWASIAQSAVAVLRPDYHFVQRLNGLVRFLLSLTVWSFVGIILCRRSALLLAGDDESTVQRAFDFGILRWGHSFLGPMIPLIAAVAVAVAAAGLGLGGRLPTGGATWMFIVSPIIMLLGFAIAFLFVATLISWPLMTAAVAADDCDSFGALSRAFSMLTGRPWLFAAYTFVALFAGAVLMAFVILLGELSIWFAITATTIGGGVEATTRSVAGPVTTMVREIVRGVGTAYFWSAATAIYLLLRKEVDGVPYERVAPDDAARPVADPLPVVGIPATDVQPDGSTLTPIEIRDVK